MKGEGNAGAVTPAKLRGGTSSNSVLTLLKLSEWF